MIVGDSKPPLSELQHFGVKGMKWGVRNNQPANAVYTSRMRQNDRSQHGKRAVERINKRMNDGATRNKALQREDVRNARQRLAILGAVVAARLLADHGSEAIVLAKEGIVFKAQSNRDAARVAESVLKIGSSAAKIKYIKPNRHGVHKITTMN